MKKQILLIILMLLLIPTVSAATLLNLTGANGGFIDGSCMRESVSTGCALSNQVILKPINGTGSIGYVALNVSSIPDTATITSFVFSVHMLSGDTGVNTDVHYWSDQTWTPASVGNLCGGGVYCAAAQNSMEELMDTFSSNSNRRYFNLTGTATKLNGVLTDDRFTLVFNITGEAEDQDWSFGQENYPVNTFEPWFEIEYTEAPATPDTISYQKYSMEKFDVYFDNVSYLLSNITYHGASSDIVRNVTFIYQDDTGTNYDREDFSLSIVNNNSYRTHFLVTGKLKQAGDTYGNFSEHHIIFNDMDAIYSYSTIYADTQNISVYRLETQPHSNGATTGFKLNDSWNTQALSGTNTEYWNQNINTSSTGSQDYIRCLNNSIGGFCFGAVSKQRPGTVDNGQYNEWAATYHILDEFDPSEGETDKFPNDFVIGYPDKNVSVVDSATNPYGRQSVQYETNNDDRSHTRAGYELTPKSNSCADGFSCFQSNAQIYMFMFLSNGTNLNDLANEINTQSNYLSQETTLIGTRYFDSQRCAWSDGGGASGNDYYFWCTQTRFFSDMNQNTKISLHFHSFACDNMLKEIEVQGWFRYTPIVAGQYQFIQDTAFGNANEGLVDSCNRVISSEFTKNYPDAREEIRERKIQATKDVFKVTNHTFTNIIQNFSFDYTSSGIEINKSNYGKNPYFKDTAAQTERGSWNINANGGTGTTATFPVDLSIHGIRCINLTDDSLLWADNFTQDTSSKYSKNALWQWDSDRNAMSILIPEGAAFYNFQPTGTNDWAPGYRCYFDIGLYSNAFHAQEVKGYINIYYGYDGDEDQYFRNRFYPDNSIPNALIITDFGSGGTNLETWKFQDWTNGVFSNNWTSSLGNGFSYNINESAYNSMWQPAFAYENALNGESIVNIGSYFTVYASESFRDAMLNNNKSLMELYQNITNATIMGYNHLYNTLHGTDNELVRRDGFFGYSPRFNDFKDDSYTYNHAYELVKMIRASNTQEWKYKVHDLPVLCYYLRYARHNQSEFSNSPAFEKQLAFFGAVDYRCTLFMENKTSYNNIVSEDNKQFVYYSDEYNINFTLSPSNDTDVFGNVAGIYYFDNHLKFNFTHGSAYGISEVSNNVRIKNVDGAILEAYENYNGITNTGNINLKVYMIENQSYNCDYTKDESYPYCIFETSFWNNSANRWDGNNSLYDTNYTKFTIDGSRNSLATETVTLNQELGLSSTTYYIYQNNSFLKSYTTSPTGDAETTFTNAGVSDYVINLTASEAPAEEPSNTTITLTSNENVQKICSYGYTVYVLLGVLIFIIIAGGLLGILTMGGSGDLTGTFIVIALTIAAIIISIVLSSYLTGFLCSMT